MRAQFVHQHFSRHFHERYAIGIIEQGAMAFRYLGRNMIAPAGQVNLVEPGEAHDGHAAENSGWAYRMFYLDVDWLHRAVSETGKSGRACRVESLSKPVSEISTGDLPHFRTGVLRDRALACSLRELHRGLESGLMSVLEQETRLLGLLTRWVTLHSNDASVMRTTAHEPDTVRTVRTLLEDRYDTDVSLSDLAQAVNRSPFHLARTFRQSVGIPPHAYLTQIRVRRAKERLALHGSIATIAMDLGFADQSHLTRHFKRHVGVTPARYRKIVQDR